jgi:2-amino-4-hydroxy-6-hydroxymethyldihydropteridine diphosphokinase
MPSTTHQPDGATKVYLGIGSNLGDRELHLKTALERLCEVLADLHCSRFWQSKARYESDQPDFFNAVVTGFTILSPRDLLHSINSIEADLGRIRDPDRPKGPRTIDIDILLYDQKIIAEKDLVIPHPLMRERKFVLLPLLELDDTCIDPVTGKFFRQFLTALPPQGLYPLSPAQYDVFYP